MADTNLYIVASSAQTRDTRQAQQRSAVPRVDRDPQAHHPQGPRHAPGYDLKSPVAFDVLLSAQQSRTPDRARPVDARPYFGERPQNSRNQTTADPAGDAPAHRTDRPDAQAAPSATIVPLYAEPIFEQASAASNSQPTDRISQSASRAYVTAGAHDGRAFATAGIEARFQPDGQGFDILV